MERREFLKGTTLGLVAPLFPLPSPSNSPRPTPYSVPVGLGIQLYTLRSLLARDFDGTLAALAGIGYREVEFAGYYERTPAQVREALAKAGLSAPAAHVGYDLLGDAWDATIEAAVTIGHRALIVPWLPPDARRTLDDYRRVAERLSRAGERAGAAGVRLGYHNHEFEFERIDGRWPLDVMLETADPAHVQLELDVFWTVKGGADPIEYLTRHAGRVRWIHAKDIDASGAMVDVGAGTLDFKAILDAGAKVGLEHAFVEHDNPASPLDTARAGYAHLKALVS